MIKSWRKQAIQIGLLFVFLLFEGIPSEKQFLFMKEGVGERLFPTRPCRTCEPAQPDGGGLQLTYRPAQRRLLHVNPALQ